MLGLRWGAGGGPVTAATAAPAVDGRRPVVEPLISVRVVAQVAALLLRLPRGGLVLTQVLDVLAADVAADERARQVGELLARDREHAEVLPQVRGLVLQAVVCHRRPVNAGTVVLGALPMKVSEVTDRELEVLVGLSRGMRNAEIGRELYVAEDTVKTHCRKLFKRLGARDRAHAVALGYELGLLP